LIKMKKQKEEYVKCNLCGADDFKIIYAKAQPKAEVALKDKYSAAKSVMCTDQVVKCNKCGLVYINPRLNDSIIIKACSSGDDKVYTSQAESRMRTFNSGLKWLEKFASKKGKLLDIGCAAGYFLKVAKDSGWDVQGVELNKWLAAQGRKRFHLKVFAGTLEKARLKPKCFDAVTMWDVIEHIPAPKETLVEVNRIMKNGGILLISTPNFSSIFAKMFGRRWWFLLSHHLYYFTPTTLDRMLSETGFKVLKLRLHVQKLELSYLIKMLKHLSGNRAVAAGCHVAIGLSEALKLGKLSIPYYAGQIDVVAKKVRDAK